MKNIKFIPFNPQDRENENDKLQIVYSEHSHLDRDFKRFDFTDEWNNLGYGPISDEPNKHSISDYQLNRDDFNNIVG